MSEDLVSVLERVLGPRITPQDKARIFQALRIEVNGELESLGRGLEAIREALGPGGVFVVLAYHSLEDRAVKNAFRDWSKSCICPPELPVCQCRGVPLGEVLTRRPVYPSAEEAEDNTRSRSARLRAWRKAA
jgi:16S rRNA (cytosine1402-N4)-methyltransferase